MGLVAGLIAAPCTGPPLAGILAYVSTTRDAVFGFVLLRHLRLGMGLPFWLLAGFSMSLPRSGAWMESVKSVFGIVAVHGGALLPQERRAAARALHRRASCASRASWRRSSSWASRSAPCTCPFTTGSRARARKGLGVALATVGLFALTNYVLTPKGATELTLAARRARGHRRRARRGAARCSSTSCANWCLPCKEFELKVFSRPEVAAQMQRFTLLRVDLTHEDDEPALGAVKKKYGADTLPAIRLVAPDGAMLARTDEFMEAEAFLRAAQ